ncbi:MAG: WD40 repeat domain-containing protein [Gemmataceae bacterium]|nr:WD40 repeat domain-containing protein [Gemmataceae bacterium]
MSQRRCDPALFASLALLCGVASLPAVAPGQGGPAQRQKAARTDLYGDPLPDGAIARLGTTRLRDVVAFAVAADGKSVAAACRDRFLRIWSLADGKELLRVPCPGTEVGAVALSADGRLLATGDNGGTRFVWETPTGVVRLWDAVTGKELLQLKGHGNQLASLAFAPGGKVLASADHHGLVILWDVSNGRELCRHEEGAGGSQVRFAPDGRLLAVGGQRRLNLYDAASGRPVRRLLRDADGAGALAFAPNGRLLAACGLRSGPAVWDIDSGKEVLRVEAGAGDRCALAFTADSKRLAFAVRDDSTWAGRLHLCEVATGKEVWRVEDPFAYTGLACTPEGRSLVCSSSDGSVGVLDPLTGREQLPFPAHRRALTALAFSPDGRRILAASAERTFRLWDARTGREMLRFTSSPKPVVLVTFAPDGKTVISAGSRDRIVRLWDAERGRELRHFSAAGEVAAVAVAPDGKTLAVAADRIIHLLDGAGQQERGRLKGHTETVRLLAFAPDSRTLVSWATDRALRAWGMAGAAAGSSRVVHQWPDRREADWAPSTAGLRFTPDGATVVFGPPTHWVEAIDLASGKELKLFDRTIHWGTSFALSPDGRLLALGGSNGTVRVYETLTRQLRRLFAGHREDVLALAFSPDNRRLASGGKDGQGLVWELLRTPPQPWGLQRAWQYLADPGGITSYEAVGQLVAVPEKAVSFLRERLAAIPANLGERIATLIADLDSKQYRVRERAAAELAQLDEPAESALRQALAGMPSLEMRQRMEKILKDRDGKPPLQELLRALRAVEVLERIGTPKARAVLTTLARGYAEARLTREARAALTRLDSHAAAR